jgi:hypothetical protein
MNGVAFVEKQFGEIAAILAGDARDKSGLGHE